LPGNDVLAVRPRIGPAIHENARKLAIEQLIAQIMKSHDQGHSDTFEISLSQFAQSYARQNERDHAALVDAVKKGKFKAAAVD
jgi:hypothetical protein